MEIIWLLAAFLVPLVINPWESNTFDLPKVALVLALALLTGLLTLQQVIRSPDLVRSIVAPSPLVWPALAFGVTLPLATTFSTNPTLSFWVAMRAGDDPPPGTIIGKALGSLEARQGTITMLVMLR